MDQSVNIFERPITETGLSAGAIDFFRRLGYPTISSIFAEETLEYEKLYEKIMKNVKSEEKLCAAQHAYNELVEYAQYYGIILKDEETQKTIRR